MRTFLILLSAIFINLSALAQSSSLKLGDVVRLGDDTYMYIKEIRSVEQNATFQKNVSIMQRYAQALKNAKDGLNNESLTESDKESLNMKIKEIEDLYVANNQAMTKFYNFSVERQYRQDHDDIYISTYLSDSEMDNLQIEGDLSLDLDKIAEVEGRKVYRQTRVQGLDNVRKFQRELFSFLNRQVELKKLEEQLLASADVLEKNNISTQISNLNKSLEETQKALLKDYNMIPHRNYFIELNNCKLYLLMTPQEILEYSKKRNGK
ncbi:MAG: hypothetical protein R3Y46_00040 [Opitutales bacterium]